MGVTYFPKSWMFARRGENINDTTKYTRIDIPNSYTIENASKIYMMPKIHKNKDPVPGRILVQGFSWMELVQNLCPSLGMPFIKS